MRKSVAAQGAAVRPGYSTTSSHASRFIQRKCSCGSHTSSQADECPECQLERRLQAKLTIGASNDPLEREADRVADQVLGRGTHNVQRGPVSVQRFTGAGVSHAGIAPGSVDRALSSPGVPLDRGLRETMEHRFGYDFSQVRVHCGGPAAASARHVSARAYTVGNDVVFGDGQFAPRTSQGLRLIAHELTHVVQQRNGTARILRRSLAGCADLVEREQGLGILSGTKVHSLIAAHFQRKVGGARRNVQIPGASAGPLRTDDICGKPSSVIVPEKGGGPGAVAGAGLPDLARVTSGRVLQVAEIKPAALVCLIDGENQLARYIDQGNAKDQAQATWRASMGVDAVTPLSSAQYPPPTLRLSTPAGTATIDTAWCTPGLLAYSVSIKRRRSRRRQRRRVPEARREPVRVRVPVRVRGYHPFFEDFANRLPVLEAPPGREFVLVLDAALFGLHVAEAHRRFTHSMTRGMRVDPRGVPLFQVQPVLIGGAIVAGFVGAVILGVILAPALAVLAVAAAKAAAAAATVAAAAAARAAVSSALRWTTVRIAAPTAAGIAALLVRQGGISEAEAAEAVNPLIDKQIAAIADVTGSPEWADGKPGQSITIDGQEFSAIIRLTTE